MYPFHRIVMKGLRCVIFINLSQMEILDMEVTDSISEDEEVNFLKQFHTGTDCLFYLGDFQFCLGPPVSNDSLTTVWDLRILAQHFHGVLKDIIERCTLYIRTVSKKFFLPLLFLVFSPSLFSFFSSYCLTLFHVFYFLNNSTNLDHL